MSGKAVDMTASGRVQGVGFRFFVRESARRLGAKGWVKNMPDGSVSIHAEGDKETLDELIGRVRQGPAFGNVSGLDVEWVEPSGSFTAFEIIY